MAQADGSCRRHRDELHRIASFQLHFLRSDPVCCCSGDNSGVFSTDLYAKNSGYISQVNNDIGDHVKRGQVLAVIEDPELQAQFDKAQAAVQQTEAALEVAKRQLAGMQADLTLQQVTLKRQKELFAGKAVTAQALDEAQAKEGVSNANVGMRKQRLDWPRRNSRPLKPKLPSSSRFCNMTRLWRHTTVS